MELYVSDTILYTRQKPDVCYSHTKTWQKPRLTDGLRHPVKIIKPAKKEVK